MSTTAEAMVKRAGDHHAEPPADTTIQIATLVHLHPRALPAKPDNVRTHLGGSGPLAASIAAWGVLEPLVVIPDGGGGHRIVAGHRRNAAAIIAEQPTVPCIVRRRPGRRRHHRIRSGDGR
jgi:ParB-like nuclease domain